MALGQGGLIQTWSGRKRVGRRGGKVLKRKVKIAFNLWRSEKPICSKNTEEEGRRNSVEKDNFLAGAFSPFFVARSKERKNNRRKREITTGNEEKEEEKGAKLSAAKN